MHQLKYLAYIILSLFTLLSLASCTDYLDAKPDKKLVVPSTLDDLQALLDNQSRLNLRGPLEAEISADDYFLNSEDWEGLSSDEHKRMYIWEKNYLFKPRVNSWSDTYTTIYYANTVLERLDNINENSTNSDNYRNIRGQALLFRAKSYLDAAFIWTQAYDQTTAESDLGLPLRLTTDFNEPSIRANLVQTYQQIISDLKDAAALLPVVPLHPMRASKPAAFGLLARTFLSMRSYKEAGVYADSALQCYGKLLDYNTLDASAKYPFARFNTEVILACRIPISQIFNSSRPKIDLAFYNSYHDNDLRRKLFFTLVGEQYTFRGSYEESVALFGGIATDELYLMRAECAARNGENRKALADLNALLVTRWKTGTFIPYTAEQVADPLGLILRERRKELLMRCLRWMDIKRLNKEGANITLTRTVFNKTYILVPNDLRYALPIPEDVIALTDMPQNSR